MKRLSLFCLVAAIALPATAVAAASDGQWGTGLLAGAVRKPYKGVGTDAIAFPLITYRNDWISITGPGADFRLARGEGFGIDLRTRYEPDGYEAKDSPFLRGMSERKGGFWAGPLVSWEAGPVTISAEWLADASGHSKGSKAKLEFERGFGEGKLRVTPRVALLWSGKKVVDYYYGVRAEEALAGRPAYEGRATSSAELGLRFTYSVAPRHLLLLDVSSTVLGDAIKESPLVERKRDNHAFTGYLYQF